jgi:hypothetical protein
MEDEVKIGQDPSKPSPPIPQKVKDLSQALANLNSALNFLFATPLLRLIFFSRLT